MKRFLMPGILIASLVLWFSITGVSAQQMPWGPGGGYPGFMGMAPPPPTKCKPVGPPPCSPYPGGGCPPPFPGFNPYACPPPMCVPPPIAEPSVFVGYLFKDHGAGINIEFNNGTVLGLNSTRNDFDLQGVWGEVALPFAVSDNASLFVTGAHLFPVQTKAIQSYRRVDGAAKREWNPDIQWWEINAGGALRFTRFASGLVGFRWSSFVVNFNDPTSQLGFANSTDDAKLTVNAYIPFFGLEVNGEPSCNSSIRAAVLGFPALPSDVEFQETVTPSDTQVSTRLSSSKTDYRSGYFLEALGEASMKVNAWTLGAFVRFDFLHTERTRDFTVGGVTSQADIQFDRRNWIIGGKLGLLF